MTDLWQQTIGTKKGPHSVMKKYIVWMLIAASLVLSVSNANAKDPIRYVMEHDPVLKHLPRPPLPRHLPSAPRFYNQSCSGGGFQAPRPRFSIGFSVNLGSRGGCTTNGPRQCVAVEGPRMIRREPMQQCEDIAVIIDVRKGEFNSEEKELLHEISNEAAEKAAKGNWSDAQIKHFVIDELGESAKRIAGIRIDRVGGGSSGRSGGATMRTSGGGEYSYRTSRSQVAMRLQPPGIGPDGGYGNYRVNGDLVQADIAPNGALRLRGDTKGYLENTDGLYFEAPKGRPQPLNQNDRYRPAP